MDPVAAAGLVNEVWHAAGAVGVLVLLLAAVLYFVYRDAVKRERRMATSLDTCRDKHEATALASTTALVEVTGAIKELNETNGQICSALRARPCLTDQTPIRPHRTPLPGG